MTSVQNVGPMSFNAQEFMPDPVRPTKLFIGGITRNTTTKHLRDHFSRFGRVLDCVAMRQADGRPRGFGYVTLDSLKAARACLVDPQVVDGRVVDMKLAVPESDMDMAPTTRLHTPANGQRPCPSILSACGGNSTPTAGSFPMVWPLSAGAVPPSPVYSSMVPPSPVYSGMPIMADAALRVPPGSLWPWAAPRALGLGPMPGAPDCMELLSTGRSNVGSPHGPFATTPTHPSWQQFPETPTGGFGLNSRAAEFVPLLSASFAEFVPQEASPLQLPPVLMSDEVQPQKLRSALGEITNRLLGGDMNKKDSSGAFRDVFAGLENSENLKPQQRASLKMRQDRLEIDTDAIYEDPENTPPGLLSTKAVKVQKAVAANKENNENNQENDDEDSNVGDYEQESGPLPSLGAANHNAGTCKRCNFYPKGRCQNGADCTFCHYSHEKRKPSRQEKRDRKAQWEGKLDGEDIQKINAYSVFPGLTTKLPTPLALPGNAYPCFPAPPPGLSLLAASAASLWQPDEEVSPVRARTPMALLATVPMSPAHCSQPAVQFLSTTPGVSPKAMEQAAVPQKVMVTMSTQTEDDQEEEFDEASGKISRGLLLKFRHSVGDEAGPCRWQVAAAN
ncbi:unnamed protein product [Polarella glacialis]|uniref:Uncharacterized protein n=1 Tax=Polarella glacialis TaxID=89957 RepID=A0A813D401_POLGL|nr:unnamed protein product [Polarella glacialis]